MFRTKGPNGDNRYVGSSKGTVIDNRDPNNRGRIRVKHPILGETSWIDYITDSGSFYIPAVGDVVFVECETALYEFPFAWGKVTMGNFAAPNTPARFQRTVPTNRGLFTPGGNFIEMDDGEATAGADPNDKTLTTKNRGIRIISKSGHKIVIQDDPDNGAETITIMDKSGAGMVFDSATKKVSVISQGDLSTQSTGNTSISADGNATVAAGGNAELKGDGGTNVGTSSSPTNVDGSAVNIAGGGPGVARIGDRAVGIGNQGAPVTSTIISGSSKAKSG